MQQSTSDKVNNIAHHMGCLDHDAQYAQYYLAEKQPMPKHLSAVFGWAASPCELVEAREGYREFNMLTYSLALNASEPVVAALCLAGAARTMEGRDIQTVFRQAADALMSLPANKPEPELRRHVEPDETEMADIVRELKSMGCTMNGTVLAKLPPLNP
jgi:hypothetical protein